MNLNEICYAIPNDPRKATWPPFALRDRPAYSSVPLHPALGLHPNRISQTQPRFQLLHNLGCRGMKEIYQAIGRVIG